MAAVAQVVRLIHAIQCAIRFPGDANRPCGHTLILASKRGGHVSAILLLLQLYLNTNLFEILLQQLHSINHVATVSASEIELRLQPLGIPRFSEQALGLLWTVLIVFRPFPKL